MKKIYAFIAGGMLLFSTATQAQSPHTVLFEEFTGENCGPCANANPYLKRFSDLNAQDSFIHMAYQVPIPSAGPIYNIYKTDANARMSYYGVNFAPWGENDGRVYPTTWSNVTGTNGNNVIVYLDSASLAGGSATANITSVGFNQRRAQTSPCTIAITHHFSAANDSVYAMAIVNTTGTYRSLSAGSLKFHLALTEKQLTYALAPGTNGETTFENVVRKLYPSANGSNMVDSLWTGRADTFWVAAKIPSYVRERAQIQFIGWVQDDISKEIKQAGYSKILAVPNLVDVLMWSDSVQGLSCTNSTTASSYAFASVKNTGGATVTSMNVKVNVDGTTVGTTPWTGTLLPGDIAQVNVGPLSLTSGRHSLQFIALSPNGTTVFSSLFDTVKGVTYVAGTSLPIPYRQDFEDTAAYPPSLTYIEAETGNPWYTSSLFRFVTSASQTFWGAEGTGHSLVYRSFIATPGQVANFYLPKINLTSATSTAFMTFWVAHEARSGSSDMLEVQTSLDCGATWSSKLTLTDPALASLSTLSTSTTTSYKPTQPGDWARHIADLSSVKGHDNVWIRFRVTAGGGDNVWIDQINIDKTVGIDNIENAELLSVYPNPAVDNLSLEIGTVRTANYEITMVNALGEEVSRVFSGAIPQGDSKFDFSTSNLPSGVYNLVIKSGDQKNVKRFVVTH